MSEANRHATTFRLRSRIWLQAAAWEYYKNTILLPPTPMRRALKTAYYLNRTLPRLVLVGRGVRLPNTAGVWIPVSDGDKKRCEVSRIVFLAHRIDADRVPYTALLTDFDVDQLEAAISPSGSE